MQQIHEEDGCDHTCGIIGHPIAELLQCHYIIFIILGIPYTLLQAPSFRFLATRRIYSFDRLQHCSTQVSVCHSCPHLHSSSSGGEECLRSSLQCVTWSRDGLILFRHILRKNIDGLISRVNVTLASHGIEALGKLLHG